MAKLSNSLHLNKSMIFVPWRAAEQAGRVRVFIGQWSQSVAI